MESVTQEKKKLRSVISFEAKAPPGYTFIPAGNPQLTNACKDICRTDGLKVFAVTTTPHMHTHGLSQHVHRIGYHFPSTVVATVCMDLGLYLTTTGKVVPIYGVGRNGIRRRSNSEVSQITINTEARDVIRDLFPNIPDKDLNQIIKTAFQKGQRKVGTAVELPLARRAQLAVVAHIRHIYTDYDRLLKTTSFHEARSLVEEPTLAKLVEWRGDDENGKKVLEDVFREVIVISDDDDSDTEEVASASLNRGHGLEIISVSSNTRAEELHARPIYYKNLSLRGSLQNISDDDEAPPGYRFIMGTTKSKIDRRGFSRYQAWDRAINRYRNEAQNRNAAMTNQDRLRKPTFPAPLQKNAQMRMSIEPSGGRSLAALPSPVKYISASNRTGPGYRVESFPDRERARPYGLHTLIAPISQRDPDPVHISGSHQEKSPMFTSDPLNASIMVSGPRDAREGDGRQFGRHARALVPFHNARTLNPQDHVLPSIEVPYSSHLGSISQDSKYRDSSKKLDASVCPITSCHPIRQNYKEHSTPDRACASNRVLKRRRLTYDEATCNVSYGSLSRAAQFVGPAVHEATHPGSKNIASRKMPVQDDSLIRKKYVAPGNRPCLGPRPPVGIQNQNYPAHSNLNSGFSVDRKQYNDLGTPAFSNYPQPELNALQRLPKPTLSKAPSGANYFVPKEDSLSRTHTFPGSFGTRPCRFIYDDISLDVHGPGQPTLEKRKLSTWRSSADGSVFDSDDGHSRRKIHSGNFFRPINSHNPSPLEYATRPPETQSNCRGRISHPVRVERHTDRHGNELSQRMELPTLGDRPHWNAQEEEPARGYTVHRTHDFESTDHYYKVQRDVLPSTERQANAYSSPTRLRPSTYIGMATRQQPRAHFPEGNSTVIVD